MTTKLKRVYWDSSCLIALWEAEPNISDEWCKAIRWTFEDMLGGKIIIVTSDLYYVEVFKGTEGEPAQRIKQELENCEYFEILTISTVVYRRAGELRKVCASKGQKLSTPDAIHIATGQLSRCEEIWTVDTSLVSKSSSGLLGSTPIVYPHVEQHRLEFDSRL